MDINEHFNLLKNKKGQAMITQAIRDRPVASRKDVDKYVKALANYLNMDQKQEAIACALSLAMSDADSAIKLMRRNGVFRASRYAYKPGLPRKIIEILLAVKVEANISHAQIEYFTSVQSLHWLAVRAAGVRAEIVSTLRPIHVAAPKTLLAFVNGLFNREDAHLHRHLCQIYSREELAEAVSMLIDLIKREFQLSVASLNSVDESILRPHKNPYNTLISGALLLCKFREAETLIDGLPYKASRNGAAVVISSIDPIIEKSVRLGYIQTDIQRGIRLYSFEQMKSEHEIPSLYLAVKDFFKAGFGDLMEVREKPMRRLVLALPIIPEFLKLIFGEQELFSEEWSDAFLLTVDQFDMPPDEITQITDRVSSLDLFKAQRLFRFISYVYEEKLAEIEDPNERNLMEIRSVIIVFEHSILLGMLRAILPDQADDVLKLLTLEENREYIDIQYTPLIKIGNYYLIAPRVVSESNLIRNVVCAHNLRPKLTQDGDPMQRAVVNALTEAGFKVASEVEMKLNGQMLELDIVAWRDSVLFLFECKNAYLPTSVHEMRNSYDHIKAAGKQLDIRVELFSQYEHQQALFKKLEWQVAAVECVRTGVLIANRIFHGSSYHGHPVRQSHEFINVLLRGEIRRKDESLVFWQGDQFSLEDIINYLDGGSIIASQFSHLLPFSTYYRFQDRMFAFESYLMDLADINTDFITRYRIKLRTLPE